MLRFQTALASLLGSLFVIPLWTGQGTAATLEDALSGTTRALDVLHGLEARLGEDPAGTLALVLSATEAPLGDETQQGERLESLRTEVNLLQMELDAFESPLTASDGAVASALGAREPLPARRSEGATGSAPRPSMNAGAAPGITTGLDDDLRALMSSSPAPRTTRAAESGLDAATGNRAPRAAREGDERADEPRYSADALRHGIACYRAGRYAETLELLGERDDANALYWRARALERLERLDEAVATMERAIARGGDGLDPERAQTDLEFLRWKRDFLATLPGHAPSGPHASGGTRP